MLFHLRALLANLYADGSACSSITLWSKPPYYCDKGELITDLLKVEWKGPISVTMDDVDRLRLGERLLQKLLGELSA